MKRKFYILGLLAILCLLVTGYYAWTLYDVHCKQMAEWKKEAKVLFEDALLVELDKRGNIPVKVKLSGQREERTLNESYPDSVTVRVGRKIEERPVRKGEFSKENTVMEMKNNSLIMKLVYFGFETVMAMKYGGRDYSDPTFKMMMTTAMDCSVSGMQINGGIKGQVLMGLVEIANGRFFKGLKMMLTK